MARSHHPAPEVKLPKDTETEAKSESDDKNDEKRTRLSSGARNLIILGVSATFIAFLTTTIGLTIYHVSGDIYLDRSRPGYLPDESEVEEESETEPEAYNFETSGSLSKEVIEEYLQHLTEELNAIDSYKDPFADSALSDDRLGIPKAEQPEQPEEPAPN